MDSLEAAVRPGSAIRAMNPRLTGPKSSNWELLANRGAWQRLWPELHLRFLPKDTTDA